MGCVSGWSFRPNSAWDSIKTTINGKRHPTICFNLPDNLFVDTIEFSIDSYLVHNYGFQVHISLIRLNEKWIQTASQIGSRRNPIWQLIPIVCKLGGKLLTVNNWPVTGCRSGPDDLVRIFSFSTHQSVVVELWSWSEISADIGLILLIALKIRSHPKWIVAIRLLNLFRVFQVQF